MPLDKATLSQLPAFQGVSDQQMIDVKQPEQVFLFEQQLETLNCVGFDTESKPTFQKGEVQTGPHLIQIATPHYTFLFPYSQFQQPALKALLANPKILKVGFGLKNDKKLLHKHQLKLEGLFDLSHQFKDFGYDNQVGIQTAVALILQQYLAKPHRVTVSNWSQQPLSLMQKRYAANDAYASLQVYLALQKIKNPSD
ncbi:3'-5' exonuclease domain-containing protein 2 [Acinetobacter sp. ME22]|uniref:3'-5' exonuclease n=1 Tax=Acinetobacter sp. ME22 TaxID=2904802 RepID=UPI001EDC2C11|nr:3'-5' exonuclease [Acinetobacter sp. ME22]MCG2573817.1 3'-5' exonuclease domain-containing protein 2 [Acinetobacter sp. ME22]